MVKYLILPSISLIAYLIRLLITGASIGDALVMIGLSSLYFAIYYYKGHIEEPVNKEIQDRIVELEEQVKVSKDKMNAIVLTSSFKR